MQYQNYRQAAEYIGSKIMGQPDMAVILGSGLGKMANDLPGAIRIPYGEIPFFPQSTVDSHKGELVFGELAGKKILFMSGRFHYYEGYPLEQTVIPVRVFYLLGIKKLIVTNAAGGVNEDFTPGDFMLITDHIKFFDESPVRGKNIPELGQRFFDLSEAYDKRFRETALEAAQSCDICLRQGIYAYMPGPQFETPAEIRALRVLGADAVGMSTVPEVIAANQCGMRVLGISCISNMAAGILSQPISDDEVVEVANRVSGQFITFLSEIIRRAAD